MKVLIFSFLMMLSVNTFAVELPVVNQVLSFDVYWEKEIDNQILVENNWDVLIKEEFIFGEETYYLVSALNRTEQYFLDFELMFNPNKTLKSIYLPSRYSDLQNLFIDDLSAWISVKLNPQDIMYRKTRIKKDMTSERYIYSMQYKEGDFYEYYFSLPDEIRVQMQKYLDGLNLISNEYQDNLLLSHWYQDEWLETKLNTKLTIKEKESSALILERLKQDVWADIFMKGYSENDLILMYEQFIGNNVFEYLADTIDEDLIYKVRRLMSDEEIEGLFYAKLNELNLKSVDILQKIHDLKPVRFRMDFEVENAIDEIMRSDGGVEYALDEIKKEHEIHIDDYLRAFVLREIKSNMDVEILNRYLNSFYTENVSSKSLKDMLWFVDDLIRNNINPEKSKDLNDLMSLYENLESKTKSEQNEILRMMEVTGLKEALTEAAKRDYYNDNIDIIKLEMFLMELAEYYVSIPVLERRNFKSYIVDVVTSAFEKKQLNDTQLQYWIDKSEYNILSRLIISKQKKAKVESISNLSVIEIEGKWPELTGSEKTNVLKNITLDYESNYWMGDLLGSKLKNSKRVKIVLERLGEGVSEFPENKDVLIEFLLKNERFSYRKIITEHLGQEYVETHAPEPIE